MSTSVIEPGNRLAGRYRLEDRVHEVGGSTFWRATDEILARPVAALTFAPGFPRVSDVVTAARAASRLSDPRLTQVFDADDSGERAYVVSEWVSGETLEDMLVSGPVEPERAVALVMEVAEALTTAHAAGLAHLRMTPSTLMWTTGGTVKVAGVAVEAVLSAAHSDDPALADTQGLARLLYAALTGYWPGDDTAATNLPHAPLIEGRPCSPRRLRPDIPPALDEVVCRALQIPHPGLQAPLTTPAAFVEALSPLPKTPLPFIALGGSTPPALLPMSSPTITPVDRAGPLHPPQRQDYQEEWRRHQPDPTAPTHHRAPPTRSRTPMVALVILVLVVVLGAGGYALSQMGGGSSNKSPTTAGKKTTGAASATPLTPLSAQGLSAPTAAGHADKHAPDNAMAVISGSGNWHTEYYFGADFGRLETGMGILYDLGKSDKIDHVTVEMPSGTGGTLQLRIGNTSDRDAMKIVGTQAGNGTVTFTVNGASGRYLLLWYTSLPHLDSMPGGQFEAKINRVTIFGSSG